MNTFPRKLRLTTNKQFIHVFNAANIKIDGGACVLRYCANGLSCPRLGIIVPKKQIPQAVRRNHFKRLARETFRLLQPKLKPMDIVVFVTSKAERFSVHENRQQLQAQFERLLLMDTAIKSSHA